MPTVIVVEYDGIPSASIDRQIEFLAGTLPREICYWPAERVRYATFTYADQIGAEIALELLHGRVIGGRKIRARVDS